MIPSSPLAKLSRASVELSFPVRPLHELLLRHAVDRAHYEYGLFGCGRQGALETMIAEERSARAETERLSRRLKSVPIEGRGEEGALTPDTAERPV
jgi:hypothetical protein